MLLPEAEAKPMQKCINNECKWGLTSFNLITPTHSVVVLVYNSGNQNRAGAS